MHRRHPIPRLWLMTDERMGDALWDALERLPRGSGVVFRHYTLEASERRALLARLAKVARRRRLALLGSRIDGPDGAHHGRRRGRLLSHPVHNRREAVAAIQAGADLVFVSPVHATRSHPGARGLGRVRLGLLIRGLPMPVIALGGMDAQKHRGLRGLGVHGWAGIDAFTRDQKRKATLTPFALSLSKPVPSKAEGCRSSSSTSGQEEGGASTSSARTG